MSENAGDFKVRLETGLPGLCLDVGQAAALSEHYVLLKKWNRVMSLTTVEDFGEAVYRHYGESLFLAQNLPEGSLRVVDIGSGAGFPGFPVAVLRPDCEVALVESIGKKASFLREAARLPNVSVVQLRGESLEGEFDWVVSRAVDPRIVVSIAARLHAECALLLGAEDARQLTGWDLLQLPWGTNRVLAVSRETRQNR